ncbi:hypothetical protein ACSDR0_17630 [Streptosporangium sp. G11]|uniref:hypothetical protein n=1 Tax=Streptosporangium sp. G11 TaxID=3436926 RepID=UPI003EBF6AEC
MNTANPLRYGEAETVPTEINVARGHRAGADVNAARNIRDTAAGHAVAARGGLPSGGPANREPQRDPLRVG